MKPDHLLKACKDHRVKTDGPVMSDFRVSPVSPEYAENLECLGSVEIGEYRDVQVPQESRVQKVRCCTYFSTFFQISV